MASNAKFGDYNLLPPNCKHQIGGQGNAPFKHFKHFKKFEKNRYNYSQQIEKLLRCLL